MLLNSRCLWLQFPNLQRNFELVGVVLVVVEEGRRPKQVVEGSKIVLLKELVHQSLKDQKKQFLRLVVVVFSMVIQQVVDKQM